MLLKHWLLAMMLVAGMAPARAKASAAVSCAVAGRAAAQLEGLPRNLLLSIGLVESGRPSPVNGQLQPWPWTVNADGQGQYFPTRAAAEAFVHFAEAAGARDIDVGCFQISLQHHPDAFASLDEAFDPADNAAYAARFLRRLKSRAGSWVAAIAAYHSAQPDLGLPYQRRVLAAWRRLGDMPPDLAVAEAVPAGPGTGVILQAPEARRVHVYEGSAPANAAWRPGLPQVIGGG